MFSDIMLCSSNEIYDFLSNTKSYDKQSEFYAGIVEVKFKEYFVEIQFYNATTNLKSINEIKKIKRSKMNRQSSIIFYYFNKILSQLIDSPVECFEWNYVDENFTYELSKNEHLFCATMRIPYIDMGSSFANKY